MGSKQNESYEKLLDLLPTVRNDAHTGTQQAIVISEPPAPPSAVKTPEIHPLRQEWIDAAEEVGEW